MKTAPGTDPEDEKPARPDLSVVIPVYNEEENLRQVVAEARDVLGREIGGTIEWVLVDDGSADGSAEVMKALADEIPSVVIVSHERNRGLGAAVWSGVCWASGAYCTWLPADGQFAPQTIVQMRRLAADADLVVLYRVNESRTQLRRFLSWGFSLLIMTIFGFDSGNFSGMYLARRALLEAVPTVSNTAVQNFAVVFAARCKGARMLVTTAGFRPRISGQSKVSNLATVIGTFKDLLKLRVVSLLRWDRG
jgi:dolichol-phosphate mannosyltransferase